MTTRAAVLASLLFRLAPLLSLVFAACDEEKPVHGELEGETDITDDANGNESSGEIAGDSGGAPDAVLEGQTGLVVDGTQKSEVASAVVELLLDPERSQAMGIRGREWIIQEWRWEIWAARFAEILKVNP